MPRPRTWVALAITAVVLTSLGALATLLLRDAGRAEQEDARESARRDRRRGLQLRLDRIPDEGPRYERPALGCEPAAWPADLDTLPQALQRAYGPGEEQPSISRDALDRVAANVEQAMSHFACSTFHPESDPRREVVLRLSLSTTIMGSGRAMELRYRLQQDGLARGERFAGTSVDQGIRERPHAEREDIVATLRRLSETPPLPLGVRQELRGALRRRLRDALTDQALDRVEEQLAWFERVSASGVFEPIEWEVPRSYGALRTAWRGLTHRRMTIAAAEAWAARDPDTDRFPEELPGLSSLSRGLPGQLVYITSDDRTRGRIELNPAIDLRFEPLEL